MPLSYFNKLSDVKVKPANVQLLLANQSAQSLHGILEDVEVRVDKFAYIVDFHVADTAREDAEVPLILGRPFMKAAKMIIDVDHGEYSITAKDESIVFHIDRGIPLRDKTTPQSSSKSKGSGFLRKPRMRVKDPESTWEFKFKKKRRSTSDTEEDSDNEGRVTNWHGGWELKGRTGMETNIILHLRPP